MCGEFPVTPLWVVVAHHHAQHHISLFPKVGDKSFFLNAFGTPGSAGFFVDDDGVFVKSDDGTVFVVPYDVGVVFDASEESTNVHVGVWCENHSFFNVRPFPRLNIF